MRLSPGMSWRQILTREILAVVAGLIVCFRGLLASVVIGIWGGLVRCRLGAMDLLPLPGAEPGTMVPILLTTGVGVRSGQHGHDQPHTRDATRASST